MILIWRLIRRDFALMAGRPGEWLMPLAFFLLVALLLPFAIGPEPSLLARLAPGILWTGALLASLIPIDRLIAPDLEDGSLDQFLVRGLAPESFAAAKIAGHWLGLWPGLMLASVPGAALLGLDGGQLLIVDLGLALGTPGLAALGVIAAALTAGIRGGGMLAGLIVLPLAVPLLIFGATALHPAGAGGLKLLAAASLILVAAAPFAAGAAIRAALE